MDDAVRPAGAVRPGPRVVRPPGSEELPVSDSSTPMVYDGEMSSVSAPEDDEQLVDYSSSPEPMNLEINVIHMSMNGFMLSEEDVAHLDLGPKDAVFQKPKATEKHLKALYMRGTSMGSQSLGFLLMEERLST